MDCKTTSRANRRIAGITLVELMVASGLGSLVMAGLFSVFVFISRSCVPMLQNVEMDRQVQNAIGWVARELREATNVVQFNTNLIVFTTPDLGNVTYKWTQDTKTLQRTCNGKVKTVLTDCDYFKLTMLQALPIDGELNLEATTNFAECKAVAIASQSSRPASPTSNVILSSAFSATAVMRVRNIHD